MIKEALLGAERPEKYIFTPPAPFIRREGRKSLTSLDLLVCCAGWGKTAYLSQLAQDFPASVCVSLGACDNSPERLCSLFAGALGILCETGGETFREAAEAFSVGTPGDTGAFREPCGGASAYAVFTRFIEKAAEKHALVLADNADAITETAAAGLMELLCGAALSGGFTLVLAARTEPVYLLGSLMSGRVNVYGTDDLRFTRAETERLILAKRGECGDIFLNALYSFTEGWCAGVSELARFRDVSELSARIASTRLPAYVNGNISSRLNFDLSEYLALTAFIEARGEDFSREVFRIYDGRQRADALIRLGILSEGEDGEPVCPEVLRAVYALSLPQEKKQGLIERASEYYIKRKRFAEAIKLFDVSGNVRAAERILKNYGEKFLENYEFELIGYCGDIISKSGRPGDPEVLGILAQYHYYCGDTEKMERALNLADSMFGKENRYSVYRKLYNGLMRYASNKEHYAKNVLSARDYLAENSLPLPFLHQAEIDTLKMITEGGAGGTRLSIYRFGAFRMTVGDSEVQPKNKKSADLIAYMLEKGGRPVPREEILNMLWPDNMPANAVAMLHNIIYSLRRELSAFGLENIISYKNKSYTLDMSMLREEDEDIIAVCSAAENADRAKIIEHEALLEKYWGRYLGTGDSRHFNERKEYYDKCFVDASMIAAEHHRERGEYDRELVFLKNASELDPYSEQIVRNYLVCCFALGKPDKAKKKYEAYSKMIDEELGILPSKWLKNEFLACFANDGE